VLNFYLRVRFVTLATRGCGRGEDDTVVPSSYVVLCCLWVPGGCGQPTEKHARGRGWRFR
jgi:hypothetical protein